MWSRRVNGGNCSFASRLTESSPLDRYPTWADLAFQKDGRLRDIAGVVFTDDLG